ncbi:MAG: cytochrome c [Candidatus Acidiferrales bacterium]
MNKRKVPGFWFSTLGIAAVVGCLVYFWIQGGNARARTQTVAEGQSVYENACAGCHEATDLQLATKPPQLNGLFRRKTLPSGAPATDEELRNVILRGRGIMPPFQNTLDSEEVNELIQYLHTK